MDRYLDLATAVFALIAAAFWFLSAYGELPKMVAYWDAAPASDPFYSAIKYGASMNRIAAVFSGLSALSAGVKLFV
jgi:hypothetical protein